MPNELKRSQPDKWFEPFHELPDAKLATNETLAMILHMEIENKTNNQIAHNLFAVVRKGNKAIGRFIICHSEGNHICEAHASNIAEYPIENQQELIEEVRNHGLMMGVAVASGASPNLKLDTSKPAFYLQTPENATNKGVIAKFAENNDPEGEVAKQIIATTLGLTQTSYPTLKNLNESLFPTLKTVSPKANEGMAATNNLAKAAKEMELIKKYGKKPMQELAKKMKYEWAGHKYTRKTIKNKPINHVN